MFKKTLVTMSLLALCSCSMNRREGESELDTMENDIVFEDSKEFLEIGPGDENESAYIDNEQEQDIVQDNLQAADDMYASNIDGNEGQAKAAGFPVIEDVKFVNYEVKKNDTLMLISYKLYGDYSKWRELVSWNKETLSSSLALEVGQILNAHPATREEVHKEGIPYLIVSGDTLGKISHKVYASTRYWKSLWYNNADIVKDPNDIFAGFVINYLEKEAAKRNLASLKRASAEMNFEKRKIEKEKKMLKGVQRGIATRDTIQL